MSIDNAMDRLRAANPAPDKRLLRAEFDDLNDLLTATWQRSTNVQTQSLQETQPPQKQSRNAWLVAAAAFAIVAIVGIGMSLIATRNDSPPAVPTAGAVVIVTHVDTSGAVSRGTFEVTDGADALQCSSGTFVDELVMPRNLVKTFTCESGPNEGTFTAKFNLTSQSNPESSDASGPWNMVEGFDDFVGLLGGGEWSIVYSSDESEAAETWTGEIEYTS